MLLLTRREGEEIVVAIDGREVLRVKVVVVKNRRTVRLSFDGKAEVWRAEIWESVRTSASAASAASSA